MCLLRRCRAASAIRGTDHLLRRVPGRPLGATPFKSGSEIMRQLKRRDAAREAAPSSCGSNTPMVGTIQVIDGPMLCRLQVWSEAQWAALPVADRPATFTHAPGLGWVGAVPIGGLN